MKVVKRLLILGMVFLNACSGGSGTQEPDDFVIDPTLGIGDSAEIINPSVAGYPLGVVSSEDGKLSLVTNRLLVDPADQVSLEALLDKYQALVVEDPNISLPEQTILDEDGAHSGGSTYKVLQIDPVLGRPGQYAKYAQQQGIPLPITVSNQDAIGILNILGQIYLEDSGKFSDLQVVPYAFEEATPLLPSIGFGIDDWATCNCLWKEDDGALKTRHGATWNGQTRDAPVYNSLLRDGAGAPMCLYNDGKDRHGERFIPQGDNVLILDFASGYTNHEGPGTGPVGNFHLWAFPSSLLPLTLPSTLDTAAPPGAVHVLLKGPSDGCEWAKPDPEQYLAYQNFILWDWDRSPDESVVMFLWEGDECKFYIGLKWCNADDQIAMFDVARSRTTGTNGVIIRDIDNSSAGVNVWDLSSERTIDLQVRTIDFCRAGTPEAKELCNGYDDSCDGKTDEGFELKGTPCDNGGIGQCRSEGTYACVSPDRQRAGEYPFQCNSIQKSPSPFEICDGIDNDCDGETDESWIQQGLACGLSVGTCGVGALGCSNGHISCEGEITPITETCDGLDNDCDGVTDEGCSCSAGQTRDCSINLGPCTLGSQTCLGDGTWSSTCSGVVPAPEVCDGVDNNCNGAADEGVLNRCGTCGPEPTEICDGIDNDCDGQVDEGVTNACGGCWTVGPEEYASGDADCDGVDNDCDGFIDETDSVVTCGVGFCERQVDTVCEICNPGLPGVEGWDQGNCLNNIDDDCDGLMDLDDLPDCFQIQGGG